MTKTAVRYQFQNLCRTNKYKLFKEQQLIYQDYCCFYCGVDFNEVRKLNVPGQDFYSLVNAPEADHIIPLTKGGTNNFENLVFACQTCNIKKGNQLNWSPQNGYATIS
jgi:5-methylcytosine-specific restriction endonuclease McrA